MSLLKQICWCLLAAFCAMAPAHAKQPDPNALSTPCTYVTGISTKIETILAANKILNCINTLPLPVAPVTWAVFDNLDARSNANDPLLFRHDTYQFQDISGFVKMADGTIKPLAPYIMGPPGLLSSAKISWQLPEDGQTIRSIILRVEGLQHLRGAAPNVEVITQSEALRDDVVLTTFYAALIGVLSMLFFYNLALYTVLRYPFILAYCCSTLAMLTFGLAWASVPMNLWPEFRLVDQISLQLQMIPISIYLIIMFMLTFVEKDNLNRPLSRLSLLLATLACVAGLIRMIDVQFAWQLIDKIYYGAISGALITMFVTAFVAWRKGSAAAGLYVLIWSIPVVAAVGRSIWGLGLIQTSNTFATISPMFIIVTEVTFSAFAVSWRIGKLKVERDIAKHLEGHLRELAETDPLTGLLNRRSFVEKACEGELPKQLVLIDIDQFKAINDTHGHQRGDEVLVRLAGLLRDHSPPTAIVGRLGGEEFAVLTRADVATGLAEALRLCVSSDKFGDDLQVTVSAGFVFAAINTEEDWRAAYSAADEALFAAKRNGRNQVRQTRLGVAA
jgi:diguanylate cyclase (GGDEF)-like protein